MSIIKSSQHRMLWNLYGSDEAFPLDGIERNRFPYQGTSNVNTKM